MWPAPSFASLTPSPLLAPLPYDEAGKRRRRRDAQIQTFRCHPHTARLKALLRPFHAIYPRRLRRPAYGLLFVVSASVFSPFLPLSVLSLAFILSVCVRFDIVDIHHQPTPQPSPVTFILAIANAACIHVKCLAPVKFSASRLSVSIRHRYFILYLDYPIGLTNSRTPTPGSRPSRLTIHPFAPSTPGHLHQVCLSSDLAICTSSSVYYPHPEPPIVRLDVHSVFTALRLSFAAALSVSFGLILHLPPDLRQPCSHQRASSWACCSHSRTVLVRHTNTLRVRKTGHRQPWRRQQKECLVRCVGQAAKLTVNQRHDRRRCICFLDSFCRCCGCFHVSVPLFHSLSRPQEASP